MALSPVDALLKLEDAVRFVAARGIASSEGSLWFNGLLSKGQQNWRGSLYMALQGEMPNLQASSFVIRWLGYQQSLCLAGQSPDSVKVLIMQFRLQRRALIEPPFICDA